MSRYNKNKKKRFSLKSLLVFLLITVAVQASKYDLRKIEENLVKDRDFIRFAFDHILPGQALYLLKPKIQKSEKFIDKGLENLSNKSFKASYFNFIKAKKIQKILINYIADIYRARTVKMSDYLNREYFDLFQTNYQAKRYLGLGKNEQYRAESYQRSFNMKLAIHTYRRARAYYFRALAKINKAHPTQFNLELSDLSSLPEYFYPPQLKKITGIFSKK